MKKNLFTLVELLLVCAIIAILASLLFPSLRRARNTARKSVCVSQVKQLSVAYATFRVDNMGAYPDVAAGTGNIHQGRVWQGSKGTDMKKNLVDRPINVYLGYTSADQETPLCICPLDEKITPAKNRWEKNGTSYSGNAYKGAPGIEGMKAAMIKNVAYTIESTETGGFVTARGSKIIYRRQAHETSKPEYPFAFVDGHVKVMTIFEGEGYEWASSRFTVKVNKNLAE